MRAGGDTIFVLLWDIIPMYTAILLCYFVSQFSSSPNIVIIIIMLGYEVVKVIPTLRRVKSGKWINNLVQDK